MSRTIRVLGVPISALVLASLLMSVLATEASASTSGGVDLQGPPVSHQYTTKPQTVSAAALKLFKRGAAVYKAKLKGHSASYQKKVLKTLSVADQKAVKFFQFPSKKLVQQRVTIKTKTKANACVPSRISHCPLGVIYSSSVPQTLSFSLTPDVFPPGGGCTQWSLDFSEGGFAAPWPFWITYYNFHLYNYFCSDGQKFTSWYTETSASQLMPLFWDYGGTSGESTSKPDIGSSNIVYFVQGNFEMSPPPIKAITGVVLHRHPWFRIHVSADGTATFEQGIA